MSPLDELGAVLDLASACRWAQVFDRVDGLARSYFLDEFFSDIRQLKVKMPRNRSEISVRAATVERTSMNTPGALYPPEVYAEPRLVNGKLSSFRVDDLTLEETLIPLGNSDDGRAVAFITVGAGGWARVVMASPSVVADPVAEPARRYREVSGGALAITHDRGMFIDDHATLRMFRAARGEMFCVHTVLMDKEELAAVTVTDISTVDLPDTAQLNQFGEQFRSPAFRLHWSTDLSLASAIESAKEPTYPANARIFNTMTDYVAEYGHPLRMMAEDEAWWTAADTDRLRTLARLSKPSTTSVDDDRQQIQAAIVDRLNDSFPSLLRAWNAQGITDRCLDDLVTITRSVTTHRVSTSDAVTTALELLRE